jgi:hypothetical protein
MRASWKRVICTHRANNKHNVAGCIKHMYEVRVNNKITMTKACYHEGVDYRLCEFELVESSMEGFLVCMNRIQCSNLLLADSV